MKTKILLLLMAVLAVVALLWKRGVDQQIEMERAAWAKDKAALEAALEKAQQVIPPAPTVIEKKQIVPVAMQSDPREIIARLEQIKIFSGPSQTRDTRFAIQQFENLIGCGTNALPAIREFLLRNQEVDYDSWISPKASRDGRVATDFVLPPSLRFGLFDAARRVGGEEAEQILSEILSSTGRGAEVAYLARVLQEMAPFKYREVAVNAAREMLSQPLTNGTVGLDKYDREYLYSVLALYGDASFASEAQAQLVRADGSLDRGALKYLQQTLGEQALGFVAQSYQDSTIDPARKEPLGRYALNFAGLNSQADDLWHRSIMDRNLSLDARRELIEDLNQDGYDSLRNPTPRDLLLITNRLTLIGRFRNEADHQIITDAFNEAEKDLRNMLDKYGKQRAP